MGRKVYMVDEPDPFGLVGNIAGAIVRILGIPLTIGAALFALGPVGGLIVCPFGLLLYAVFGQWPNFWSTAQAFGLCILVCALVAGGYSWLKKRSVTLACLLVVVVFGGFDYAVYWSMVHDPPRAATTHYRATAPSASKTPIVKIFHARRSRQSP